jgi:hypothetical protein
VQECDAAVSAAADVADVVAVAVAVGVYYSYEEEIESSL